jgi:hypothetical protein
MKQFVFFILSNYGLQIALLFVLIAVILLIKNRNKEKVRYFLFTLLLVLPGFWALLSPEITLDQPWMLRRYLFMILPMAYIALAVVLVKFKKSAIIFVALLVILNLVISAPILTLVEYNGAREFTGKIAEKIPDNSFVFVDRFVLKDYEITGPLFFIYDKNSFRVYGEDLKKLNVPNKTIYFITHNNPWRNDWSEIEPYFPRENWEFIYETNVTLTYLQKTCELLKEEGSGGKVGRLDFDDAKKRCGNMPKSITENYTIQIFKLNDTYKEEFLKKQEVVDKYKSQRIFLNPLSRFSIKNDTLVCSENESCYIDYKLPDEPDIHKVFILTAKPVNVTENYDLVLKTNNNASIFNIQNQQGRFVPANYTSPDSGTMVIKIDKNCFLYNYCKIKLMPKEDLQIINITFVPR